VPAWKYHVFVCENARPPGHPKGSCGERGAGTYRAALKNMVERFDLFETVKVTGSTCLGPCRQGPTLVVYPEGTWYVGVTPEDLPVIVQQHFIGGQPVQRLVAEQRSA